MDSKLLLESVLFFLLSFYVLELSLASYTQMTNIQYQIDCIKGNKITAVENTKPIVAEISSNVIYVRSDSEHKTIRSRSFSREEIEVITKVAGKMDSASFLEFMDNCFVMDMPDFIYMAKSQLKNDMVVARK